MKCRWCSNDTEYPCGPRDFEVCPSCFLAVDSDDFLCQAPTLKDALAVKEGEQKAREEQEELL